MDIPIRGWTFTHWWVRPVTKIWFNIYHKSVTYSGVENIDWKKPIIFAPSHRNAFTDALCIILHEKHRNNHIIYPLIRGDAFGNKAFLDWILTSFHMMPVYRPRDKVDMVAKNKLVFEQCYELLAKKRNLLIHAEGNCIPQNRMRSFKKGLARIAFGAEEKHQFNLGVQIIPVGITYREITAERKGIHVQYGKPVSVADFEDQYRQNEAIAIKELTQGLHQNVSAQTVDLPKKNYPLADDLLKLNKSTSTEYSDHVKYEQAEFRTNQEVANLVKKLNRQDEGRVKQLAAKMDELKNLLDQHSLSLKRPLIEPASTISFILQAICFLILSPFVFYGWLNHLIPWTLMRRLADKVQEAQFISSARMTLGLIFFPVFYLLQTLIVFGITFPLTGRWFWCLVYLASLPVMGLLALNWHERLQSWRQKLRLYRLHDQAKQKIHRLIEQILGSD